MRSCRLIYRSVAEPQALAQDALAALERQCVENNGRSGIKGLLVVSGDRFLQVLEGPPRFVNELFGRIVHDGRHHQVELIDYEDTVRPHFFDWSMRLVELADLAGDLRALFDGKYPSRGGVIEFPDDPLLVHSLLLDVRFVASRADAQD